MVDATWIKDVNWGRLKTVDARKPDRKKESIVSNKPNTVLKTKPATKMLFMLAVLFSDLYWAVNFVIALLTPQSLNNEIRFGAVKAIEYKPNSEGANSLATKTVPAAEMTVEATNPHRRWKLPLAETLAISAALLILFFTGFSCMILS
jgi:hypothetical protein